jgi:hypothetical protein
MHQANNHSGHLDSTSWYLLVNFENDDDTKYTNKVDVIDNLNSKLAANCTHYDIHSHQDS